MALSAVLRTEERFGAGHLIDILLGEATDKVRELGPRPAADLRRRPRPGTGAQWQAMFRQMAGARPRAPRPRRATARCGMTEAARPVLRGEAPVTLRRDALHPARPAAAATALVAEEDAPPPRRAQGATPALAQAQGVPAYVVFPDRTLIEMAERRPHDARRDGADRRRRRGQARSATGLRSWPSSPARRPRRSTRSASASPGTRRATSSTGCTPRSATFSGARTVPAGRCR